MSKTGFAMFLAGATVGAAATWLCLRRYYEQIAQEEIDSVKAAFAERKPVNTNIAKNEKLSGELAKLGLFLGGKFTPQGIVALVIALTIVIAW